MLYAIPLFVFILSGCIVRTYPLTRDRVDQNLSGNRGYLTGAPSGEEAARKTTRRTQVVEVELRSPIKIDRSKCKGAAPVENPAAESGELAMGNEGNVQLSEGTNYENYTVSKNDTLQKISQRFFGTTRKWNKIFEANRDILKGPNSIYPGQVIRIPVEPAEKVHGKLK